MFDQIEFFPANTSATVKQQHEKPGETDHKIITPGGPRAESLVRQVEPGEAVRINEQGIALVVPKAVANSALEAKMNPDFILTPGGYRHRSLVHRVEPGHAIRPSCDRVQTLNLATGALSDVPHSGTPLGVFPALGSGWIATSYWNNGTGNPITTFRTTWQVPPVPATSSGQLIYLFNGITRFSSNSAILQPVLQWGDSPDGGGPFWAVASWYVHTSGQAFYTPLVKVNSGDAVIGVMTLTNQNAGKFDYMSEFQGIAGTSLPVQNIDELLWCSETVEAYGITQCSDYPNTDFTAFQAIGIQTGNVTPAINWGVENAVIDCGQHAVVVSNSDTNGEVDIYYRSRVS